MSKPQSMLHSQRVLFADDLDFAQRGTAMLLTEAGLAVEVCESGTALRRKIDVQPYGFDIVIVDVLTLSSDFLPEQHIPELVRQYPHFIFIIFSSEDINVAHYLDQGVRGYVSKGDGVRGLLLVLEAVLLGATACCSTSVSVNARLSSREREVLKLVADGLVGKEIARQLGIALVTVEEYYTRIRVKLGATGLAHAIAIAFRARLMR